MRLLRIRPGRPGSNQLVSHTLRHFVREGSGFERCVEAGTVDGAEARGLLLDAGVPRAQIAALPHSDPELRHQPGHERWWASGSLEVVISIHDQGYAPRYEAILAKHLPPRSPSPVWSRSGRRWTLEDPGSGARIVAAEVRGGTALQVISALRPAVTRSPEPVLRSPEGDVLAEILRGSRR